MLHIETICTIRKILNILAFLFKYVFKVKLRETKIDVK